MSSGIRSFRRSIQSLLEYLVVTLMASLAVLVILGVGFRKAGAALVWYDEVAAILLAWLTYYGSALAALHRAHIGFPRGTARWSPRLQRLTGVVRDAVVIAFFLLLAWAGWRVLQVVSGTFLVSLPWFPRTVAQSVIPIGALLYVLAEVLNLRREPGEDGETAQ